jgi:eukaryotic-like serine/threonine-protein kinase
VYRAVQHSMEREVALKLLKRSLSDDRTIVRRFLQEAKGASKLNHPNVITLFDFGQTEDGELYIVMELLEGESLQDLLQREKRLSTSRTVAIMSQVCDALQAAHDAGVIHRDLKPDNVHVISGAGQMGEFIKVLDFGIAKVAAAQHTSQLTQTGSVCGTPAYMSPEQAMGQEIDSRSDVYATGILLYEMLSGQPPFVAETPVALMMAQVRDLPLPLSKTQPGLNIRPELDALLLETLAKKPEDRPQSAAILKDRLTRILDGPATIRTIDTGPVSMDLSYMPTETHMALENTSDSEQLSDAKPPETQPVFSANTMDLIDATSKSRRLPWAIAAVLFIAIVAILAYQLGGKDEKKKMNATLVAPTTAT